MSRPSTATFAPEFRGQIPGSDQDPRFWAGGISLIAHPWNPNVPTVHMNTRFVGDRRSRGSAAAPTSPRCSTAAARRTIRTRSPSTRPMQRGLRRASPARGLRAATRRWCDEYFFLQAPQRAARHRRHLLRLPLDRRPGTGISPSPAPSAQAFLEIYPRSSAATVAKAWTEGDRDRAAGPARALCRVQPALRPGHDLRPEDRRQHRLDPLLHAADGAVAVVQASSRTSVAKIRDRVREAPSIPPPLAGEGLSACRRGRSAMLRKSLYVITGLVPVIPARRSAESHRIGMAGTRPARDVAGTKGLLQSHHPECSPQGEGNAR